MEFGNKTGPSLVTLRRVISRVGWLLRVERNQKNVSEAVEPLSRDAC